MSSQSFEDFPAAGTRSACTKMAVKLAWILTHFQAGFQSHSSQGCNTEERQDSVTHNIYSQQGGARSTAGPALGCGKESQGKAKAAAHISRLKLTRHTHTYAYIRSKTVTHRHTGNILSESVPYTYTLQVCAQFAAYPASFCHSSYSKGWTITSEKLHVNSLPPTHSYI